jgi:hypothetical protein
VDRLSFWRALNVSQSQRSVPRVCRAFFARITRDIRALPVIAPRARALENRRSSSILISILLFALNSPEFPDPADFPHFRLLISSASSAKIVKFPNLGTTLRHLKA